MCYLCCHMTRFAKDEILWSCLAAMSAFAKEFETAEIAYAAIDQVIYKVAHSCLKLLKSCSKLLIVDTKLLIVDSKLLTCCLKVALKLL